MLNQSSPTVFLNDLIRAVEDYLDTFNNHTQTQIKLTARPASLPVKSNNRHLKPILPGQERAERMIDVTLFDVARIDHHELVINESACFVLVRDTGKNLIHIYNTDASEYAPPLKVNTFVRDGEAIDPQRLADRVLTVIRCYLMGRCFSRVFSNPSGYNQIISQDVNDDGKKLILVAQSIEKMMAHELKHHQPIRQSLLGLTHSYFITNDRNEGTVCTTTLIKNTRDPNYLRVQINGAMGEFRIDETTPIGIPATVVAAWVVGQLKEADDAMKS